nr:hypothetical protein Iba_scaffold17016CG0010 [Ipomoea batatas]
MSKASVPVVVYLSFLASNSAITKAFNALADHFGCFPEGDFSTSLHGRSNATVATTQLRRLEVGTFQFGTRIESSRPRKEQGRDFRLGAGEFSDCGRLQDCEGDGIEKNDKL